MYIDRIKGTDDFMVGMYLCEKDEPRENYSLMDFVSDICNSSEADFFVEEDNMCYSSTMYLGNYKTNMMYMVDSYDSNRYAQGKTVILDALEPCITEKEV